MKSLADISTIRRSRCAIKALDLADLKQIQKKICDWEIQQIVLQIAIQVKELEEEEKSLADINQIILIYTKTVKNAQNLIESNPTFAKQLLTIHKDSKFFALFKKYGTTRQAKSYYRYMQAIQSLKIPEETKSKSALFINKKISLLKQASNGFDMKNHESQSKQLEYQAPNLLEKYPEKESLKKEPSISRLNQLKEQRWAIHEYSLKQLKQIFSQLRDTNSISLEIAHQVILRIKQLTFVKKIEFNVAESLRGESQSAWFYKNLIQINEKSKLNNLRQQKDYDQTACIQKKKQLREMEKILAGIVLDEQNLVQKSSQQQSSFFKILTKDQIDITQVLKLCRWKLYFLSLENLIEVKKRISKDDEKATKIRTFITLRIKQLRKKREDLQIIAQILPQTKWFRKKIRAEIEEFLFSQNEGLI